MGELADRAKQRSPFLKLEAGESLVAAYKGYKMVPSSYDPEKENYRFLLEVEIMGEKSTKYWDTGSNKVAIVFDTVKVGELVKITKNIIKGKNGKEQTSWEVEPVASKDGSVTKKQASKINQEMAG
jgi:hypothetical protein